MIEFGARRRRGSCGIDAAFVLGDMRDLDRALGPFDLAYVLLGSLYVRSNREFLDHLDRMAGVLAPGGLYLLDSFVWFRIFHDYKRSWTRRKGRGDRPYPLSRRADRSGRANLQRVPDLHCRRPRQARSSSDGRVPAKVFFPQEFLCLVELSGRFEFIGWYNDFSFAAELKPEGRHLAILRRR